MDFTNEQKEMVKKLQKVMLANVLYCNDDVRPSIIAKFKDVKYRFLTKEEFEEKELSKSIAAFFSPKNNEICINPNNRLNDREFQQILLHEMLHAHSFGGKTTGLSFEENRDVTNSEYVNHFKFRMIDECATEFFTSSFLNKSMLSYKKFVPIFASLSNVCGYEKFMTYYFTNNHKKFVEAIMESYHLKDDYLINKLFMQMDQCFNLEKGFENSVLLKEAYKTLCEINIQKLNFENGKKLSNEELLSKMDLNQILNIFETKDWETAEYLRDIKKDLKQFVKNYVPQKQTDFKQVEKTVVSFVLDRLNCNKNANYDEYKKYFQNNLCDVLLYLDQNITFNVNNYGLSNDLAINEVLNFLHDESNHINLSNYSKDEKHYIVNSIMQNCKHNITKLDNQLYYADVMTEFEEPKSYEFEY